MPISCDRLIEIAANVPWETFEKIQDGHAVLMDLNGEALTEDEYATNCYSFYLRVGLHMKRPIQAIISEGFFIRMRSGKKWEQYPLTQVNPTNPKEAVYSNISTGSPYGFSPYINQYGVPSHQHQILSTLSCPPSNNFIRAHWDPKEVFELEVTSQALGTAQQTISVVQMNLLRQHRAQQNQFAPSVLGIGPTGPLGPLQANQSIGQLLRNLFAGKPYP